MGSHDDEFDDSDARPRERHYASDEKHESTAVKFMRMLERNMLDGWGKARTQRWSTDLGVPVDTFEAMWGAIRASWKQPTLTFESFMEQRDIARARYLDVYAKSMERGSFATALQAVTAIVKLDGLEQPEKLNILIGNATPGQGGITNTARETVAILVEKMKEMQAARQSSDNAVAHAVLKLEEGKAEEKEKKSNGQNGHKKPIIEIEGTYPGENGKKPS